MRVALYWAPEPGDALAIAGNAWLGRDPECGVDVTQPCISGIGEATAAPRLYGFHATLRPPMRLITGWEDFLVAVRALAAGLAPFDLPPLVVDNLDGFLALREAVPCQALHTLAAACVRATDTHRLAPSPAELAQRLAAGLSPAEEALLRRWGYPYVMERWRFHMTLTRRLAGEEPKRLRPAAEAHFAESLAMRRRVTEIAVFTQASVSPPAPFLIAERIRLG
jgi:hypothetical protein